jgi:hypothetical protein
LIALILSSFSLKKTVLPAACGATAWPFVVGACCKYNFGTARPSITIIIIIAVVVIVIVVFFFVFFYYRRLGCRSNQLESVSSGTLPDLAAPAPAIEYIHSWPLAKNCLLCRTAGQVSLIQWRLIYLAVRPNH